MSDREEYAEVGEEENLPDIEDIVLHIYERVEDLEEALSGLILDFQVMFSCMLEAGRFSMDAFERIKEKMLMDLREEQIRLENPQR